MKTKILSGNCIPKNEAERVLILELAKNNLIINTRELLRLEYMVKIHKENIAESSASIYRLKTTRYNEKKKKK